METAWNMKILSSLKKQWNYVNAIKNLSIIWILCRCARLNSECCYSLQFINHYLYYEIDCNNWISPWISHFGRQYALYTNKCNYVVFYRSNQTRWRINSWIMWTDLTTNETHFHLILFEQLARIEFIWLE